MRSRFWIGMVLAVCLIGGLLSAFAEQSVASALEDLEQPFIRLAVPYHATHARTQNSNASAQTNSANDQSSPSNNHAARARTSQPPRGFLAPFFTRNHRRQASPRPMISMLANRQSTAPLLPRVVRTTPQVARTTPRPAITYAPFSSTPPPPPAEENGGATAAPETVSANNQDTGSATLKLAQRDASPPAAPLPPSDQVTIDAPTEPPVSASPAPTPPPSVPDERVLTIDRNNPPAPSTIASQQPPRPARTPAPPELSAPVLRPVTPVPAATAKLSVYMTGPAKVLHDEYASVLVRVVNSGQGAAREVVLDIAGNDQLLKRMPIGAVPPGRSVEVELQLTPQVLGNLELQALARASNGERAIAVRTMFVGKPHLVLAIAGPPTVNHGEVQIYTAIVDNQGSADAEDVSVLVMLGGNSAQTLDVGDVLAGQRRRIAFELRPEHGGTLVLNAVATCVGGPQAVANGSINVLKQDIELALEGPQQLRLGESARYTLSIRNQGNVDAGHVVVNVSLCESVLDGLFEGDLATGEQKQVMFEVSPAQPGRQTLTAVAQTDNGAKAATTARLQVQHGQLELVAAGPAAKFSGGNATYDVTVKNVGDAPAADVLITAHLPPGAEYLDGVERIDFYEGVTWRAGLLAPGEQRTYHLECLLETPGEQSIVFSAAGAGELSATREVVTTVEALADIRLFVGDPQGLIELGELAVYEIELHNRGAKAAHNVQVKMLLGDALRPQSTDGLAAEVNASGVHFEPIDTLGPKETRKIRVTMQAELAGNHQFRVEVSAIDPKTFVASEGTTRFYAKTQPIHPDPAAQLPIQRLANPLRAPLR